MSLYRKVELGFWQDEFVLELTPEQKYFFMYLMTNQKTSCAGTYKLTFRMMNFETGYNNETIRKILEYFVEKEKILYDFELNEIYIVNWHKYNWTSSEKYLKRVVKDLDEINSILFKSKVINKLILSYEYSIETLNSKLGYRIDILCIPYIYGIGEKQQKTDEETPINVDNTERVDGFESDENIPYGYPIDTLCIQKEQEQEKEKEKEIRTKNKRESKKASSKSPSPSKIKNTNLPFDYQSIVDYYNLTCKDLEDIEIMTDDRKKKLESLINEFGILKVHSAIDKIAESHFLCGVNNRGWTASFNFLLDKPSFVKILENQYANKKTNAGVNQKKDNFNNFDARGKQYSEKELEEILGIGKQAGAN